MPFALLTTDTRAVASTQSIVVVGTLVTVFGMAILLALLHIGTSGWKALTWVSVGVLTFWHGIGGGIDTPVPNWLIQIGMVLLIAAAAGRLSHHRYMRSGLMVASLTLAAVLGTLTVASSNAPNPIVGAQQPQGAIDLQRHPDIYLVVLDGYGRTDVIDRLFGYDNTGFETQLEERGFKVLSGAKTNYTVTHFSIPAMLNMSYMHPHVGPIGNGDLLALAEDIGGDNELVRILKENGYRYVHGETITPFNRCGEQVDVCLRGPLLDMTASRLLQETAVGGLISGITVDPATSLNRMRIEQMTAWSALEPTLGSGPKFTFLHLILPHPPLFLDHKCSARFDSDLRGTILNDGEIEEAHLEMRRQAWLGQVECANQTMLTFLDEIDIDDLVVVTSDHGPDSAYRLFGDIADYSTEEIGERVPTFSAVRLPNCDDDTVPEDAALVNLFRYVLSCLADEPPDPLPDKTYLASFGGYVLEVKP